MPLPGTSSKLLSGAPDAFAEIAADGTVCFSGDALARLRQARGTVYADSVVNLVMRRVAACPFCGRGPGIPNIAGRCAD